jgi:hypothetical protein
MGQAAGPWARRPRAQGAALALEWLKLPAAQGFAALAAFIGRFPGQRLWLWQAAEDTAVQRGRGGPPRRAGAAPSGDDPSPTYFL